MSELPEVELPKCPVCGMTLDQHWRGRPCLAAPEMAAMAERINRATPEDIIRATRRLREQGQHDAIRFAMEFEAMGNSASIHALNEANSASRGEK